MTDVVTTPIRFFTHAELECRGSRRRDANGKGIPGTGVIRMDPRFAHHLPILRERWDRAVVPNSVCRTPQHNRAVGGHVSSLHLTENPRWGVATMAMDWPWRGWTYADQLAFARLAVSLGWRVGLHDGFAHVDRLRDVTKPGQYPIVFLYGTYTGRLPAGLITFV